MAKEFIGDLHLIEISAIITSTLIHFLVPAPSPWPGAQQLSGLSPTSEKERDHTGGLAFSGLCWIPKE